MTCLTDVYIKDQLSRVIANDELQAHLLAKAGMLKSLKQNVCHTEAFESVLWDQSSNASTSDIAVSWMSTYCRQKNSISQTNKGNVCTSTKYNYKDSGAEPNLH